MAHRKRPKLASAYRRGGPSREPYDVVLIVCEGTKSEPNYFDGLRQAYGLSSVNVRILRPPGQDPMNIVTFAIRQIDSDPDYDRAYCVFDRNGHASFDAALQAVSQSDHGKQEKLIAIPSVPCFEIWVLLHYRYTTAAYVAGGGHSSCERVIKDVLQHYPLYAKGRATVFSDLAGSLESALKHAVRLEKYNAQSDSSNPSTKMHRVVQYLIGLKK